MSESHASAEHALRAHEVHTARTFPVARQSLFAAFADAAVLAAWWGPHGSVNEFEAFDLRPGGAWQSVMRAADGAAYRMTNEFLDVVEPERVTLRHLQAGHEFELHMHYDALGAAHTRLRWCMRFADAAEAARVRALVAEANEQNFDRLEAVLGLPPGREPRAALPAV
jgi:uncharacterized protein YndB with AHSA1/START domain